MPSGRLRARTVASGRLRARTVASAGTAAEGGTAALRGRTAALWSVVLALLALLAGCGEEEADLDVAPREDGQVVIDQAGVLDGSVADALRAIEGWDVVAAAYETEQANAGEAHRAGQTVVEAWDADVALVAVAAPGDFTSTEETRRRYFGATPAEVRAVPADLREQLVDEVVPPYAADNDWPGAFVAAARRLAEELE